MTGDGGHGRGLPRRADGAESLREWRFRAYLDHLEDLGYDLDGGGDPSDEPVPDAGQPAGVITSETSVAAAG